jgi:hypothetical protein
MKMLGGREEEKYTTPVPTEKRTQMPENQNTSPDTYSPVEEGEIPF